MLGGVFVTAFTFRDVGVIAPGSLGSHVPAFLCAGIRSRGTPPKGGGWRWGWWQLASKGKGGNSVVGE